MLTSLLRRFQYCRRGATALIFALMLPVLLICSGAAVDFSRAASARAQLQAAVDAAALAGVGVYQNGGGQTQAANGNTVASASDATNVAKSAFTASVANLNNYLAITAPVITPGCTSPNGAQCGAAPYTASCTNASGATNGYYCVNVSTSGVLKTSLLALVIRNVTISVSSQAITPIPTTPIGGKNFQATNVANAYDRNGIYAYGVPLAANNKPEYGVLPAVSSSCTGPILNGGTTSTGTCQYYQIGDSTAVTLQQALLNLTTKVDGTVIQPIAFLFANFTGGTTHYNWVSQPDGGYCPDWTLYGSISQENGVNVPPMDSLNVYSSAFEMIGQPPTYTTNHQITGFTVPQGVGGNSLPENCPYYSYHYNGSVVTGAYPANTYPQWNATYFSNNRFSGGPAVLSGCTPSTNPSHPWLYSGSNLGYCPNATAQAAKFSNCALLIEDLGPNFPTNPDITTATGFSPMPSPPALPLSYTVGADTIGRSILLPNYVSAQGGPSGFPPASTAHRCYDPGTAYNTTTPNAFDTTSILYDEIENPGAGAVLCNSQAPENYALYWNDLGSNESDDIGYWNAISLFTCSVPGTNGAYTSPATLSE